MEWLVSDQGVAKNRNYDQDVYVEEGGKLI